jgi:Esterase PHB depolymerase
MKISASSLILAIASTLAVIGIAIYLFFPLSKLKSLAGLLGSAPPLGTYGIDIQQTSVSGVSAGAAMAVQMHVAHSSIMRGVGVIAGVAYDCADSSLPSAMQRMLRGLDLCLTGSGDADANFSVGRTTDAAGIPGAIDDPALNLPRQKVWLFSGYNDGAVLRAAMNAVAGYYQNYIDPSNIFYKTNSPAPHALITNDYGGQCLSIDHDFINNCSYDMAGRLLQHIYGRINPPSSSGLSGSILAFDQSEFVVGANPRSVGLADTGYVYVPVACQTQNSACRVHVFFHGCLQYAGRVGDAVYKHGGYNKWADANRIVVLYPQTVNTDFDPVNPEGCWDWWGLSDPLPKSADYARKTGYQISAIKAMLDRLAQTFVPGGGSSNTFGIPQQFSAPDSTSTSVELIWEANSAAAGFNIYRSPTSAGTYTKINSQPVSGASFVDRGLTQSATYYYEARAVDGSNQESAPTSPPVPGGTAPAPPACDPYFSNNVVHVSKFRAYTILGDTRALGSNDQMGLFTIDNLNQLTKYAPFSYRVGYCP